MLIILTIAPDKRGTRKIFFSSPGLCPWRGYVVTQALASASALAQCLSFQMCA